MSISEAVQLVLQASVYGSNGELFILDMGEPIKIIDLARDLIRFYGYQPDKDIQIEITELRKGEKISEEVLHDQEHDSATKHDKIFITTSVACNAFTLRQKIRHLEKLCKNAHVQKVRDSVMSLAHCTDSAS